MIIFRTHLQITLLVNSEIKVINIIVVVIIDLLCPDDNGKHCEESDKECEEQED